MTQNDLTLRTHELTLNGGLQLRVDEQGSGRPIVLLHGGAGPRSLAGLAAALAPEARVLVPTHPGFGGTPRPEWFDSVADLGLAYAELLERLELRDAILIGQSLGGWVAAETALRDASRLSGLVLMNAVGVHVDGHPITNVNALSPAELSALAYYDPARFRIDPATLTPELLAIIAGNRATLNVYGGPNQYDPKLLRRLARVRVPALMIWGENDGVVDVAYGRGFAAGFAQSRFELLEKAGHFPNLEQPERTLSLIREFAKAPSAAK